VPELKRPAVTTPPSPPVVETPPVRATAPLAPRVAPPVPATAPSDAVDLTGAPATPRAPLPSTGPAPGTGTAGAKGSPSAENAATPATPASAPPRLNLDLPSSRGGQLAGQGPRGLVPLLPAPPERKSKITEGIEKSTRADCRTAHADMGLLGVIPLAADTVRDKGCRW